MAKKSLSTIFIVVLLIGSYLSALTEREQALLNDLRVNAAQARQALDSIYYQPTASYMDRARAVSRQSLLGVITTARRLQQEGVTPQLGYELDRFIAQQGRYLRDDEFRHLPGEVMGTPHRPAGRRLRRNHYSSRRTLFPDSGNGVALAGLGS